MPCVLHREIRPPNPRSEATAYAVTKGNIAKLAAAALVALPVVLLSARTIGYRGKHCSGGESVSQSPLKDKAFSISPKQNLPIELRPKLAFPVSLSSFCLGLQFRSARSKAHVLVGYRTSRKAA